MITKPMLAVAAEDITYPVLATPKLDGIRCLVVNGKAVSRKFKPIPNNHIRCLIETNCLDGFDGEIMIPGEDFNKVQSLVMSVEGTPEFEYHVFDFVSFGGLKEPYSDRMERLGSLENLPSFVKLVLPRTLHCAEELAVYEAQCVNGGYEGIMTRKPDGPYKCGRSTAREGYLLKVKRFEDSEAVVIGFEELMTNQNEQTRDELGHAKRSTNRDGLVPADTLGTLLVQDIRTGVEFGIGSGFTAAQRKEIWDRRRHYLAQLVTYKHQPSGHKDRPRFPVFKGFRHRDDIS